MEFSKPAQILAQVPGIGPGSVLVDLGCGSGHYTLILCRMSEPGGRVYAVDIQKELLERVARNVQGEGHSNLEIVWGDIDQYGGSKLRTECADVVVLSNVLFQLADKQQGIQEATRVLRTGGRLLVVDWTDSHFGLGPAPELVVTKQEGQKLLEQSDYLVLEKEIDAGTYHWALVYCKGA